MKTSYLILSLGIVVAFPGVAQEAAPFPGVTAEAGACFTVGQSDEIVYPNSSTQNKLSELLWPVPLSPGISTAVRLQWAPWIVTSLRFETIFPLSTGDMTDDDWNVSGNLYDSNGNLCTRFHSDSTAYLTSDWDLAFDVQVPFQTGLLRWNLSLGVDYRQICWEAWNTNQTNTLASDGSSYSFSMSGLSGTYRQNWIFGYVGGGLTVPWAGFLWGFQVKISPFPYLSATDAHILRQLTFNDTLDGGFMVEPELTWDWPLAKNLSIKVSLDYQGAFFLRGAEVVSNDGAQPGSSSSGFTSYSNVSGAVLQVFTGGVSLETTL